MVLGILTPITLKCERPGAVASAKTSIGHLVLCMRLSGSAIYVYAFYGCAVPTKMPLVMLYSCKRPWLIPEQVMHRPHEGWVRLNVNLSSNLMTC